ncbi:MAG: flippase-like domain-containing protein [Phycisphaerales bacterium]|nr:flippase-like domain-containing protein [Phycisphaerales bacterium]
MRSPRLLQFIRLFLITAGIAVVVIAVHWGDGVEVTAGWKLGTLPPEDASRYVPVEGAAYLDSGMWSVTLEDGQKVVVDEAVFRPGILRMLADAGGFFLVLSLLVVGCVHPLQATRWWILMRVRGLRAPWVRTLRLVYIGAFSNFLLPGTEGGDVVKAWGAAKGTDRRMDAVMSVVFDRITGLVGLAILAAVFSFALAESDLAREIGAWTWIGLLVVFVGGIGAFAAMLRGWLRLPGVVARFGGGLPGKLEAAFRSYGHHPWAICGATGVSVLVQLCLAAAAAGCAWSVGSEHTLWVMLAAMPVLFLAAAVPLTWQGVGVMEAIGIALLATPGLATVNQVVGTLVLYRLLELTWALVGGLLLLRGDVQLRPQIPPSQ